MTRYWAGACLGLLGAGAALAADAPGPVWPQLPDPARIRYVMALPGDMAPPVRKPSVFMKVIRFAVGLGEATEAAERTLYRPTGLCVRGDLVYVADLGLRCVVRFDLAARKVDRLGSFRDAFTSPVGVAAAADGRLWVSDSTPGRVVALTPKGKLAGVLDPPPGGWGRPTGLALDESRGRLWVADTGMHRVHAYNLAGRHQFASGARGDGPGEFNFPTYLAVNELDGSLIVCDSANFRVQVLDADGKPLRRMGEAGNRPGFLSRPRGVAVDGEGHVYVVDAAFETVQILDAKGRLLLFFGQSGEAPGSFAMPGGIFIDARDRVFVADTYNGRVQIFQYLKGGA
ncbi:MAG: 6-bladed beta-propeller [Candidatus Coatesbacteria bacterium]